MKLRASGPAILLLAFGETKAADPSFRFVLQADGHLGSILGVDLAPDAPFGFGVQAVVEMVDRPPGASLLTDLCGLFSMVVEHDPRVLRLDEVRAGDELAGFSFVTARRFERDSREGFLAGTPICEDSTLIPFDGEMSLVRARYTWIAPHGADRIGESIATALRFRDGWGPINMPPISVRFSFEGRNYEPVTQDLEVRVRIREDRPFSRGDANYDGAFDISDPVTILHGLFLGDAAILCEDAADSNDDGRVDLTDPIHALDYLFRGGSPPPPPFPSAGSDPTPDLVFCFDRSGT